MILTCLTNRTACSRSISLLGETSRDRATKTSMQCFCMTLKASKEVSRYLRTRKAPALTSLTPLSRERRALERAGGRRGNSAKK